MITGLKVHTGDGLVAWPDVSENSSTEEFLADLLASTHRGGPQSWALHDGSSSGRMLRSNLTLGQNQIGNNHTLFLVRAQGSAVQVFDVDVCAPDGRTSRFNEVKSSTKISELLAWGVKALALQKVDARGRSIEWALFQQRSGNLLENDKTLAETGLGRREVLLLQQVTKVGPIAIEGVSPAGSSYKQELPPATQTGVFRDRLVEQFALPKINHGKDLIGWFLRDDRSKQKLEADNSLAENGVESGDRILIEAPPGVCLFFTVSTSGKEARQFVVPGDTPVSEFVETLVVSFAVQQQGKRGRPHIWVLVRPDNTRLDPDKTLAANGVKTGDHLSLLLTTPDLRLEISAPKGEPFDTEEPGYFLASDLLRESIQRLSLKDTDEKGNKVDWTLRDKGTGRTLVPASSLAANKLEDGDKLVLVPVVKKHFPPLILDRKKLLRIGFLLLGLLILAGLGLGIRSYISGRARAPIEITPQAANLLPGQAVAFHARTKDGADVKAHWSIVPGIGTVSQDGVYTALANVTGPTSVVVTATRIEDSSVSAQAAVSLSPRPVQPPIVVPQPLTLAPQNPSLGPSQPTGFLVNGQPYSGSNLKWSLQPDLGTISSAGIYTAPATITSAGTVTVTASDPTGLQASGQATISLRPSAPPRIFPQTAALGGSQTLQLVLRPAAAGPVQWSLRPALGSISGSGFYTAPTVVAGAATVTVIANSPASGVTVTAKINLQPIAVGPVALSGSSNGRYFFRASVANARNNGIIWTINPQFGSISPDGVYTAPAQVPSPRTVEIIATSTADPGKSSHFELPLSTTLPAVRIAINPHPAVLQSGQRVQLSTTVTGTANTKVTWASSGLGSMGGFGLYTAPPAVPPSGATVHITVTSDADPRVIATTEIMLRPAPAYVGPKSGSVTFQGDVGRNQTVIISNGGSGISGAFPGVPIEVVAADKNVQIVTQPSPANGWKAVVVQTHAREKSISVVWRVIENDRTGQGTK